VEGEEGSATLWEGLPPYPMNSGRACRSSKLGEGIRFLSHIPRISLGPLAAFEVRQHRNVEQFGAGSRAEGFKALT
jgi:hypothetical protein